VTGFPTIMRVNSSGEFEAYKGPREESALIAFCKWQQTIGRIATFIAETFTQNVSSSVSKIKPTKKPTITQKIKPTKKPTITQKLTQSVTKIKSKIKQTFTKKIKPKIKSTIKSTFAQIKPTIEKKIKPTIAKKIKPTIAKIA
jgi:hypothetical protein